MNTHPYVRGYMAGIVVPTIFLLLIMSTYFVLRFVMHVPVAIERVIVFPMAGVPNLWGAWNALYVWSRKGRHLPVGVHGALLPLILAPTGFAVGRALGVLSAREGIITYFEQYRVDYVLVAVGVCLAMVIYYLVWKYFVNFFNELLGVA